MATAIKVHLLNMTYLLIQVFMYLISIYIIYLKNISIYIYMYKMRMRIQVSSNDPWKKTFIEVFHTKCWFCVNYVTG